MRTFGFLVLVAVAVGAGLWHFGFVEVSGEVEVTNDAVHVYNESLDTAAKKIKSLKKQAQKQ